MTSSLRYSIKFFLSSNVYSRRLLYSRKSLNKMASRFPIFIDAEEVSELLDMATLISTVEKALGNFSAGEKGGVVQPVRTAVPVKEAEGYLLVMPGYSSKDEALATKLVSLYPNNQGSEFPSHQGIVLLFNSNNGSLTALMDGEVITIKRTAAASAAATKYLAPENSKVLSILGAGHQAHSHLEALQLNHNFEEIRIWSKTFASAEKFANKYSIKACKTAEEAVRGADVIVTVTLSTSPVVEAGWLKPGAHINCVGACRPDWQEIDPEVMRNSKVYVDSREAAMKESGDIILSKAEVYGEIGEVVLGTKEAYRNQTTVFKSLGMAVEDVVSAKLVYDRYIEKNTKYK